jgi:hypothetical protein
LLPLIVARIQSAASAHPAVSPQRKWCHTIFDRRSHRYQAGIWSEFALGKLTGPGSFKWRAGGRGSIRRDVWRRSSRPRLDASRHPSPSWADVARGRRRALPN